MFISSGNMKDRELRKDVDAICRCFNRCIKNIQLFQGCISELR